MSNIEMTIVSNEIVSEKPFFESADIRGLYLLTDGEGSQIAIPSPGSDKVLLIKLKQG